MMRVACVADVHIGNHSRYANYDGLGVVRTMNWRCRKTVKVLEAALKMAKYRKCDEFWVAGDLFHGVRPTPQMIDAVQEAVLAADIKVRFLLGNHEQYTTACLDHSLAPLRPVGTVIDSVGWYGQVGAIPYRPGKAWSWLPSAADNLIGRGVDVIVTHLGISDDDTPPFLIGADDSVDVGMMVEVAKTVSARFVLAGNWHRRKVWRVDGTTIMQVGALVPTGFSNLGLTGYGTLAIVDTDTGQLTWDALPGPRFVKASSHDEVMAALNHPIAVPPFVEFLVPKDKQRYWTEEFEDNMKGSVDVVVASEDEKIGGGPTTETVSSDDVIAEYVRSMDLDPRCDRDNVLSRVTAYVCEKDACLVREDLQEMGR